MTEPAVLPEDAVALTIDGVLTNTSADPVPELVKSESEPVECRICFMSEPADEFSMPCSCTAPVHIGCLERWCLEKGSPRCEICHVQYKLENRAYQQRIENALAAHTARHRAPPRSALELLISGDQGGNEFARMLQNLRAAQRSNRFQDIEDEEEMIRQIQTRRLLLFAAMVLMAIITVHILGTFLLSATPHGSGSLTKTGVNGLRDHSFSSNSTSHFNPGSTNSTLRHGRHHHGDNTVLGRFFRMLLFFYVIRMLFTRPPPPNHRGGIYL